MEKSFITSGPGCFSLLVEFLLLCVSLSEFKCPFLLVP